MSFTSQLWQGVFSLADVQLRMSFSYHPPLLTIGTILMINELLADSLLMVSIYSFWLDNSTTVTVLFVVVDHSNHFCISTTLEARSLGKPILFFFFLKQQPYVQSSCKLVLIRNCVSNFP